MWVTSRVAACLSNASMVASDPPKMKSWAASGRLRERTARRSGVDVSCAERWGVLTDGMKGCDVRCEQHKLVWQNKVAVQQSDGTAPQLITARYTLTSKRSWG